MTDTDAARLRADVQDPRPEVRARAIDGLLALDWDVARDCLLGALDTVPWADRARLLGALDARFGLINADRVLALLAVRLPGDGASPRGQAPSPEHAEHDAMILAELAQVFLSFGDLARARSAATRARSAAPREISRARAQAEHVLALTLMRERQVEAPLGLLRSALGAFQRLEDAGREAEIRDSLGALHFTRLDLAEAEYCFKRSLAIRTESGDTRGQATTAGNLGRLALLRGEHEQALEWLHRSRRLCIDVGDDHGLSVRANQLGEAYLQAGDLERARSSVQEGVEAASRSHDPRDEAHCELMLGRIDAEQRLFPQARARLLHAHGLFAALGDDKNVARTDLLLGRLERGASDLAAARARLDAARERFDRIGDRAGEASAWLETALLCQVEGAGPARAAALERGLDLAVHLPRTAVQRELHFMHAQFAAGSWLAEAGVADPVEIAKLIEMGYRAGRGLGRLLVSRGHVTAAEFGRILREHAAVEPAGPAALAGPAVREAAARIARRVAERLCALPIAGTETALRVAMADPLDFAGLLELELATGCAIEPLFATEEQLLPAIHRAYVRPRLGLERFAEASDAMKQLLDHAAEAGASDVHVEPRRDAFVVRLRIDGVLHEIDRLGLDPGRKLLSRLKILSGMDITERRLAQDGRLRHGSGAGTWNLRLATLPTMHGEKLVIRILGALQILSLHELGLDDGTARELKAFVTRQEGMLLVVGPTGSGKSTTLQAILSEVDASERCVVTVEDPVEFEVESFAQSQVAPDAGYGYAEALKALLRQDPNVIMLGEIRDGESATIAARMALTGHLVLSSLHTYDAPAAVTRLVQMGVPPYVVAAVVKCVLAQRLVRRLCDACREPQALDSHWMRAFDPAGVMADVLDGADVRGAAGCKRCGFRGYKGRVPVFELLALGGELGGLVRDAASETELRQAAAREGFRPMALSALARVAAGQTSQEEIVRVL